MNSEFWLKKWNKNEIAFHQETVNSKLIDFIQNRICIQPRLALVPLCGKTLDMLYLQQQGFEVWGVELSEKAIRDFLNENSLEQFRVDRWKSFKRFRCSNGITLLCGDFFKLSKEDLSTKGPVLCFDRASLIALPAKQRRPYADHLKKILPPKSELFTIVIEYPQREMDGPPFSVTLEELKDLFSENFKIKKTHQVEIKKEKRGDKFQDLSFFIESSFQLTSKV
jgi:thiopurine S-methyltransferase